MISFLILLASITSNPYENSRFESIEYFIYIGYGSNGIINDPGLVFRIYENGNLLICNRKGCSYRKIDKAFFNKLKSKFLHVVENYGEPMSGDETFKVFGSSLGESQYYWNHGAASCLVFNQKNMQTMLMMDFVLKKGSVSKPLKKILREGRKIPVAEEIKKPDRDDIFILAMPTYYTLQEREEALLKEKRERQKH